MTAYRQHAGRTGAGAGCRHGYGADLPPIKQTGVPTAVSSRTGRRFPTRRRLFSGLIAALILVAGLAAGIAGGGGDARAAAAEPLILALGDSLTAGYGLPEDQGFVPRLEAALAAEGTRARVVNAGVSGDTTAGGLARLDWALGGLTRAPDLVIVSLGANDALRGLDPAKAEDNLAGILTILGERGLPTLLVGMRAPNNWGPDYRAAFDGMYDRLAARFDVPLDPFFLEGVALEPGLVQADGLHPNADGAERMAGRLAPVVIRALQESRVPEVPAQS